MEIQTIEIFVVQKIKGHGNLLLVLYFVIKLQETADKYKKLRTTLSVFIYVV